MCRLGNIVIWKLKCSKETLNLFHYLNSNIPRESLRNLLHLLSKHVHHYSLAWICLVYVRGHKYVLGPTQTHFSPSRSILVGCLDRTIIWFSFFIGLFQRAKIHFSPPNSILARKMRHNARQSDNNRRLVTVVPSFSLSKSRYFFPLQLAFAQKCPSGLSRC